MTYDPTSFEPDSQAVEMPCEIVAMETIGGRLMVVLADGRTVDMTDMFIGEAKQ